MSAGPAPLCPPLPSFHLAVLGDLRGLFFQRWQIFVMVKQLRNYGVLQMLNIFPLRIFLFDKNKMVFNMGQNQK